MTDAKTGPQLFAAWIADTGRKQTWVAAQLTVTHYVIGSWASGKTKPQPSNRAAIETLTGGAVPATSWKGN